MRMLFRVPQSVVLCIVILAFTASFAEKNAQIDEKQKKLQNLREQVQLARDSLQSEVAKRWSERQKSVEQKEHDKAEIDRLVNEQSRVIAELSVLREEVLSSEARLAEARDLLQGKRDEWQYVKTALGGKFQEYSRDIDGSFPIDMESDRSALESVRNDFAADGNVSRAVTAFFGVITSRVDRGKAISYQESSIIPDNENLQTVKLVRFGNVLGYALSDSGHVYTIRQTGKAGLARYSVVRIESEKLIEDLSRKFPVWVESSHVTTPVLVDVLQNDISSVLVSGKAEGFSAKIQKFIKAGGPVMYPLLLLPLWAFTLIVLKFIQLFGQRRKHRKTWKICDDYLNKNEIAGLNKFLESRKDRASLLAHTLIQKSSAGKQATLDFAKEMLLGYTAKLGSHLDTLAVLAAVAPLLGLLGTVTGMIRLFGVITSFGTGDPKILAGGISEALITTETGLAIAIPILLFHNYLKNKRGKVLSELQTFALHLANRICRD